MLHLLANPGIFHQIATPLWDVLLLDILPVSLTGFTILFLLLMFNEGLYGWKNPKKNYTIAIILVLLSGGGLIASSQHGDNTIAQTQSLEEKYDSSVMNWLASDYGIKVTTSEVNQLIAGKSTATVYEGKKIVISVTAVVGDKLAVINRSSTILEPTAN